MLVRRRAAPLPVVSAAGHRAPMEPDDQPDRGYAGDAELVFEGP